MGQKKGRVLFIEQSKDMTYRFVADVGGTHIRIARCSGLNIFDVEQFKCADFATISHAITHYFSRYSRYEFSSGCLAVASFMGEDRVDMLNNPWHFSVELLREELKLNSLFVINDFTAVALSVPYLSQQQTDQIGRGATQAGKPVAVCGPGTGLGVGFLIPYGDDWIPIDGEGGHMDFAPTSEDGLIIYQFLEDKLGRVSYEDVLSGRGLLHIYEALAHHEKQELECTTPQHVSLKGLNKACSLCHKSLHVFCDTLGDFAANLALVSGAFGGVYLSGGVLHHFKTLLFNSGFRHAFENKGRLNPYLENIPTYFITEPTHGLIGAAVHLEKMLIGVLDDR